MMIEVLAQIPAALIDASSFYIYALAVATFALPIVVVGRLAYAFLKD